MNEYPATHVTVQAQKQISQNIEKKYFFAIIEFRSALKSSPSLGIKLGVFSVWRGISRNLPMPASAAPLALTQDKDGLPHQNLKLFSTIAARVDVT